MRARRLLTVVSLGATGLFSFGCGDVRVGDPTPDPPAGNGPSGVPTPPGLPDEPDQPKLPPGPLAEVSGVYRTTYITEHGDIPGPPPPASLRVSALVPDGEGFITYPGELAADAYREPEAWELSIISCARRLDTVCVCVCVCVWRV